MNCNLSSMLLNILNLHVGLKHFNDIALLTEIRINLDMTCICWFDSFKMFKMCFMDTDEYT